MRLFSKKKETIADEVEAAAVCQGAETHAKAYAAYQALVEVMAMRKPTKADLTAAIEEAISHLGGILAD